MSYHFRDDRTLAQLMAQKIGGIHKVAWEDETGRTVPYPVASFCVVHVKMKNSRPGEIGLGGWRGPKAEAIEVLSRYGELPS